MKFLHPQQVVEVRWLNYCRRKVESQNREDPCTVTNYTNHASDHVINHWYLAWELSHMSPTKDHL